MKKTLKQLWVVILSIGYVPLWGGNSVINGLAIDENGSIVAAGFANNDNDQTIGYAFARYLPNGSLDTTFNPNGLVPGLQQIGLSNFFARGQNNALLHPPDEEVTGMALDAEGRIIAVGFSTIGLVSAISIIRLTPNGLLDTTFNQNGQLGPVPGVALLSLGNFGNTATGVAIDSQGRIVVVGTKDNGVTLDLCALRLISQGALDTTFNAQGPMPGVFIFSTKFDVGASSVALNPDDSIVMGGTINTNVSTDFLVMKLTSAGLIDTAFNAQSLTPGFVTQTFQKFNDEAFALKIDSLQRIIVAGSSSNGVKTDLALARYTSDGLLDETFNPDVLGGVPGTLLTQVSKNNDAIRSIALTPDNRIIAAGFTDDGTNSSFITVRYNEDGSLDQAFNPDGPVQGILVTTIPPTQNFSTQFGISSLNEAHAVVLGQNNEIFIGGFSFDGLQQNFTVINYEEDGSLNTTFNPFRLVSFVQGIVITPFGQSFTVPGNGVSRFVYNETPGVSPYLLEKLAFSPQPYEPIITSDFLAAFKDPFPTLKGTASPNAIVSLYINNELYASTVARYSGQWEMAVPPLFDGHYEAHAVSIDPLSGVSLASLPYSFTIKTEVPSTPVIEQPISEQLLTHKSLTVRGRADGGTLVTISIDDKDYAPALVSDQGIWQVEIPFLSEGKHSVTARARNAVGRESDLALPVSFRVDLHEEIAPRIITPRSGLVTDQPVNLTGKGAPGKSIALMNRDILVATVPVSGDGSWSYTLKSAPGTYELTAQSPTTKRTSEKVLLTIEKPGLKKVQLAESEALSPSKGSGVIQGTAQPNSSLSLFSDNRLLGTTRASSQGTWSFVLPESVLPKSSPKMNTPPIKTVPVKTTTVETSSVRLAPTEKIIMGTTPAGIGSIGIAPLVGEPVQPVPVDPGSFKRVHPEEAPPVTVQDTAVLATPIPLKIVITNPAGDVKTLEQNLTL